MEITNKSSEALKKDFLDLYSCDQSVYIDFTDLIIEVKCNDTDLAEGIKDYFREFLTDNANSSMTVYAAQSDNVSSDLSYTVKQPDPGKKKIKEESFELSDGRVIRKVITGMVFIIGGENNLAIGPCLDNINQVVNFINNRFIEHLLNKDCLLLHAAAISWQGKGFAVAGFSGAGKSTLSLHMMGHDLEFISNDRLLMRVEDSKLTMYGVIKYPRINPGTIINNKDIESLIPPEERTRLKKMPLEELWNLEQKYDLFIDKVYGPDKFKVSSEMKGLIILNWKRTTDPIVINEIALKNRPDLFPAFMKSPGLFYRYNDNSPDLSEDNYQSLLSKCTVYEVTGGYDFKAAAEFFAKKLKNEG